MQPEQVMYSLSFTITGSQQTCLQWQGQLNEFLQEKRMPLPPGVNIKIEALGGGGRAAPPPLDATLAPKLFMPPREEAPPQMATFNKSISMPSPAKPMRPKGATSYLPPHVSRSLDQVKASIRKHGAVGINSIGRKFRIVDDSGDGHIQAPEFAKAMAELGFKFPDTELRELFNVFDDNHDGTINYDEFLGAVRPPMTIKRKRLVQKIFEMLDLNKNGILTASDVKARFRPQGDPRVQQRQMSAEAVAKEFLSTFDVCDQNGEVGLEEFTKYYQGVSASIDDDSYFELMLRNAWHYSGGDGASQCTSCLHVLVEHSDGSQEVVEVRNDLGLDVDNYQEIVGRLAQQGVQDIKDMKRYS